MPQVCLLIIYVFIHIDNINTDLELLHSATHFVLELDNLITLKNPQ